MLLVNFLFWTGVAQGAFIWAAILRTAQATWAAGVNRLAHAFVGFLPFSLLLYAVLYVGRHHWLTWLRHPVPEKAAWLNAPFFFLRDGMALALMTALSYLLVAWYRKGEAALQTGEGDLHRAHSRANKLATLLVILYAVLYSLIAFDMVMSLEPHWTSTLFGGLFFVGNLYAGVALLILVAAVVREPLGLTDYLGKRQFIDLGNLMLGFNIFYTGLVFAHNLTIWYGNLPGEVVYLIPRVYQYPWRAVAWFLLVACFLIPFFVLQFEEVKGSPRRLCPIAVLVLFSMWVQRWMMVVPAFSPHRLAGLTPLAWCIPVLCAGMMLWVVATSLARNPQVSSLDLALRLDGVGAAKCPD
ncbi:MAG: hypothetical protein AUJ92_09885 [Armatimonadetes bacterium CG2_30_59_28]|nr:MAG: hypothetical protein AUJ92_09885 [Armatimonadetes bacterium CG2_30_59_28]PIU61223.1 MAG: hypothetical protein COS85_21385 [Armatimonadetes bacterium CG07_land_8_20_14_0_80_59_28]PIX46193.1 MAG: hypothetical protein COZ56_00045 [Armatimonadetes bacterium CG_4_8_14_3_um_filter_58_9]PIY41195.1 MAG: hypothetical protein COZ05_16095 [Armatimonadetes bacterium CG_4_10_14_3_um_filter_59_10]PJB75909.1 MAG: hypothetical protein CO095_03185 [Armatimonadetes bacterium CG_4_9_14_3_um_filter_58_7]